MAQFVKIFDDDLVDVAPIVSRLGRPPDEISEQFIDVPLMVDRHLRQYIDELNKEFNYFRVFKEYSCRTKVVHYPKHTYYSYKFEEVGGLFNFHVYLNDCTTSTVEIFSPFTNSFLRFKPRAGLVVIYPAFWGVMVRMSNTLEESVTFIKGFIR